MTTEVAPPGKLRAVLASIERAGPWVVPPELEVRVLWGSAELDLREAVLSPGVTTIRVRVTMGNLEIIVPRELPTEVAVTASGGHVGQGPQGTAGAAPRLRVIGHVRAGNCEVETLLPGETREDFHRRLRRERHRHHAHHHARMSELRAEREMWRYQPNRSPWLPWWLQSRMRRRMFTWFAIMFAAGVAFGTYAWVDARWWHVVLAAIGLSMVSGAVAWRLSRPLLAVVRAARDIGDGKLDTRLPTRHGGEMRVLATAINDMAVRIEQQLKDQRQLLAAVSHELRTPLGHMRVLIDTSRETKDPKTLDELEREVLMLDDLVGKLLASSRLEFGNLELRELDLGELVTDVATSAGIAPEAIEAIGSVRAKIDPTLVRRAISNLIDNARVHGNGAVAVRVERRGSQVAIEVDDAGPGVPADRRADSFRAFVPSSGGGLGLGLALVSRIAVAHGGGAWISDRPGGGARIGFTIAAG